MRRKLNVRMLALVLGGSAILAVGIHFLHSFQMQQNAFRLLEQGDRALAAKDYNKALNAYGQYLVLVPNDAEALQKYVQALDVLATGGERFRLVLLMEQVLRVKPNEHELRFRLVHNLIALDRINDAIDHLRNLQRHWPDKAQVVHMLGWCYEAKEDYPRAVQSFEEAVALNPKRVESYALLIEILYERRNLVDEAQKAADDMVQQNRDNAEAYLVRARFQRRRNNDREAQQDLESAFNLAPDRADVLLALADAARARGDQERAASLLRDGLKAHPHHAEFYKHLIDHHLRAGQRGEALAAARTGLEKVPESIDLAVLHADLLIDDEQFAEAARKVDDLLKAGSSATLPNYLAARLKAADQKWSDAIKLLEDVAKELGPNSEWQGRTNVLLGLCFQNLGDHESALSAYRRAVAADPTFVVANLGLASALLDANRSDDAIQTLEAIGNQSGLSIDYWILLGRARFAQQGRLPQKDRSWDKTDEALARAAKLDPKNVEVALVRASILAAQGDFKDAALLLEQLRQDHPRHLGVRMALADLAVQQNRWDDADKILMQASEEIDDGLPVRLARSRLYSQRGNPSDRAKLAQLAAGLPAKFTKESTSRLQRALAEAWLRLNEPARAEKLLRDVSSALPRDLGSRLMLLDLAIERRQSNAARSLLDEIRAIDGESVRWRIGAIALQIQEARGERSQLEDARRKLQALEKTYKNSPRIALMNATICERLNEPQQAIREYSRALELGDMRPPTLGRLVQLLVARRDYGAAEAEILKFERLAPLPKELARVGAEVAMGLRDERYARVAAARAELAVTKPIRDYRDALWLARIYQAAGENARAEALFEGAIDQAGYAPEVWIEWMKFLAASEQRPRGTQELERMAKAVSKDRIELTHARCLDALRQPQEAANAFEQALQARPNDVATLRFAAEFYDRADDAGEARKLYARLLDPELAVPAEWFAPVRRRLAVLLANSSHRRAIDLLDANQKATGADESDERVRLYVQSFNSTTARQNSLEKFQKSFHRTPPTADERVLYAQMLNAANLPGQASAQLAEAVNEQPTNAQYVARYIQQLIRGNDLDGAERQLKRLEELEPSSERLRGLRTLLANAKDPK